MNQPNKPECYGLSTWCCCEKCQEYHKWVTENYGLTVGPPRDENVYISGTVHENLLKIHANDVTKSYNSPYYIETEQAAGIDAIEFAEWIRRWGIRPSEHPYGKWLGPALGTFDYYTTEELYNKFKKEKQNNSLI